MNISSKLYDQSSLNNFHNYTQKDNVNELIENYQYIKTKKLKRPISSINVKMPVKTYKNEHSENKNKKTFEQEYKKFNIGNLTNIDLDLLFEKQLQKLREINKSEEEEYNSKINNNLDKNKKEITEEKNYNNINQISNLKKNVIRKNNSFNRVKSSKLIKSRPLSNYDKTPDKLLPSLQTIIPKSKNEIHPKCLSSKNAKENKILFNKINSIPRPILEYRAIMHRDYGRVPKYIREMRINAKLLKDIEKKKEEEKSYPKGTRLLSEEERIFTLEKLKENKKDLENLVTKLPIASDSIWTKNKQRKLFKELDEIDQAIITFSKNKVFVKMDN